MKLLDIPTPVYAIMVFPIMAQGLAISQRVRFSRQCWTHKQVVAFLPLIW